MYKTLFLFLENYHAMHSKINLKIIKLNLLLTNKNNYLIIFGDLGKKCILIFRFEMDFRGFWKEICEN